MKQSEDKQQKPRKRKYRWNLPQQPRHDQRAFDYESEAFVNEVYDLALDGYYDCEISRKLGIAHSTFCKAQDKYPVIREALEKARARASEGHGTTERPSPTYFAELVKNCEGKTSRVLRTLGISYKTLRRWCREDKRLEAILDIQNLEFLEQLNMTGRILSLGIVNSDSNKFPGWAEQPNSQVLMFYLNSIGAKYGFGKNSEAIEAEALEEEYEEAEGDIAGIPIDKWIDREMLGHGSADADRSDTNTEDNNDTDTAAE